MSSSFFTPVTLEIPVFSDFPPPSYDKWRKIVDAELKGIPFEKKFTTQTYEGFTLQPIYRAEDAQNLESSWPGFFPYTRGRRASGYLSDLWEISQQWPYATAREFNKAVRHDLSRGLTSLNLNLDHATRQGLDPDCAREGEVGQGGVSISTLKELAVTLEDVDLEKIPVFVRSGSSALSFAALFIALIKERDLSLSHVVGCIEMDPLGVLSHEGTLPQSLEGAYREMAVLTRWAIKNTSHLQTICIHGRPYHESGGNSAQELACAIATGVEYLREMQNRGLSVNDVAPKIRFAFCVGSNFFMEIAKLRAARTLWSKIISLFGGSEDASRMKIHVTTDLWNKTKLDSHVNILRATTEAFAGVLGGCDSLKVGSFNEPLGMTDEFARHIARNTQIILQSEANLRRLIDPSGGSWYIEWLTNALAEKSWAFFQEIEKRGGMFQALKENFVQIEIEKITAEKKKNFFTRKDILVGTNIYTNPAEKYPQSQTLDYAKIYHDCVQEVREFRTSHDNATHQEVIRKLAAVMDSNDENLLDAAIAAASTGATLGEITRVIRAREGERPRINPLQPHRLAEDFENLREKVDTWTHQNGRKPKAFLINLGSLSQYKARADFSKEFLTTGGFEIIDSHGFENPEEGAHAAIHSGAEIAVICSTDEKYLSLVSPVAGILKKEKSNLVVVLAGWPTEQIDTYRAAGVDEFIHLRANILETLQNLLRRIGVLS